MRFNNIQVVRIVAAIAVVLAHLAHYARHQFHTEAFPVVVFGTGSWMCILVPLFFTISGFVLTHAIQKARPGPFLFARALRVYPGFWLATILVAVAIALTGWPDPLPLKDRLKWIGWTLRPGEFGSRLYVLGVEWSLVFEVVLYLCLVAMSRLGTRRGLPIATLVWLVVLCAKVAIWPGLGMNSPADSLPTWKTFFNSAVNIPFLGGILLYYVHDRGRRWRWAVFTGLVAYLALVPARFETLEGLWCVYSVAAAATIWFVVQIRQLPAANPLVVAGEYSYGLYLLHVPLVMGTFAILLANGWLLDSTAGVLLAGAVAIVVGMAFGRLEFAIHMRLRPLTKMRLGSLKGLFSLRVLRTRIRV